MNGKKLIVLSILAILWGVVGTSIYIFFELVHHGLGSVLYRADVYDYIVQLTLGFPAFLAGVLDNIIRALTGYNFSFFIFILPSIIAFLILFILDYIITKLRFKK